MKKFYTTLFSLAVIASAASAQQLPNADFEGEWTDCYPWTSSGNTTIITGTTPTPWTVSNVIGLSGIGKTVVGEPAEGHDSNGAVKLTNKSMLGQVIPGYMSLGTTWATSTLKGFSPDPASKDGGSFGGISFTFRPDAISFYYQRSHGAESTEKASVVAYMWKGTYSQADVPGEVSGSEPSTVTMEDRDRNILGIATTKGGAVTSDGCERIAKINYDITGDAAEWTSLNIPFEYESTVAPEKINVAFAAGDYFSTDPEKDNVLIIDDVKLLYYSRLASLKVNGKDVELKEGQYDYILTPDFAEAPADKSAFEAACLGNSGSASAAIEYDQATGKAVITVTNSNAGGTDIDGESQHVYTVQFKDNSNPATVVETKTFYGTLTVLLAGEGSDMDNTPVILEKMSDGTYTMRLENFGADASNPEGMGSIVVTGITLTGNQLKGSAPEISLMGGAIKASAELTGTYNEGSDNISLTINCIWKEQPELPIDVTFNGKTSAIGNIYIDSTDAPAEYYNIQGMRCDGENLAPGLYIRRQGNEVSKILVR